MDNLNSIQWPGWKTVRLIGRGSFGAVYEIERDVFGTVEKAALKHIGLPQNASDVEEMYSDGYDDESVTAAIRSHLQSIVAEYSLMRKLNGSANVVNCDDVRYVQREDGIGWDIYIKMELLTPLTKALPNRIPEDTVRRVATDLCQALVLCKRFGIIHRDIKPQNIFVSPLGDYKLGDFGIAKTVEKTMGGTKTGTYKYMSPEVYNNRPYGQQADVYSLGLVLYWMLNERRMPFLPLPPQKLTAGLDEQARNRRLQGEPLPPPAHGSDALKQIVLKACAYDPKDRYHSAEEMLEALNGSERGTNGSPQIDAKPPQEEKAADRPVASETDEHAEQPAYGVSPEGKPDETAGEAAPVPENVEATAPSQPVSAYENQIADRDDQPAWMEQQAPQQRFCAKCGTRLPYIGASCPVCEKASAVVEETEPEQSGDDGADVPAPEKKRKRWIWIAAAAVLALAAACVVLVISLKKNAAPAAAVETSPADTAEAAAAAPAATAAPAPAATSAPAPVETAAPALVEEGAPVSVSGKVGILFPTNALLRWANDGAVLKAQLEDVGCDVTLDFSDNNITRQNEDIVNLVSQGVDVLIIAPIDFYSTAPYLTDAAAAGVRIIVYDRLPSGVKIDFCVTYDNYSIGKLQGEYVAHALGLDNGAAGPFHIEFFAGDPGDTIARTFYEGAMAALKQYINAGTLKVVSGQNTFEQAATTYWDTQYAQDRMNTILSSYYSNGTQLDAVLCSNDSTAQGVIQAIDSRYSGGNTVIVTGQDCDEASLKYIVDGKQSMSIFKNTSDLAEVAKEITVDFLSGRTPGSDTLRRIDCEATFDQSYDNGYDIVPTFCPAPYVINKNNLQLLIDTGLFGKGSDGYLYYK